MRGASAALLLPLVLVGCGYSPQYNAPGGIQSVAVSVFQNRTLYSGVELELTDALVKEIGSKTPLRVRTGAEAEAELSGALEDYGLRVLREGAEGEVSEYQLRALVSLKLVSTRSGEVLCEARNVGWQVDYLPKLGETEAQAREELLKGLARKIVSRALENW